MAQTPEPTVAELIEKIENLTNIIIEMDEAVERKFSSIGVILKDQQEINSMVRQWIRGMTERQLHKDE